MSHHHSNNLPYTSSAEATRGIANRCSRCRNIINKAIGDL